LSASLIRLSDGAVIPLPVSPTFGYYNLHRVDLTDIFAAIANGGYYELELIVQNVSTHFTGIIAYLSYDYSTEKRRYIYKIPYSASSFWYTITLPFRPISHTTISLHNLFPWADSARYYDYLTGSYVGLNINASLSGTNGDVVRTYTIQLLDDNSPHSKSMYFSDTIVGYPIYEQRYLDINTDYDLWFGTVNCEILIDEVGDYPNGIISSDETYYCSAADTWYDLRWHSPTSVVTPRYGYYMVPQHPSSYYHRPYSVDMYCSSLLLALEEEDLEEPLYFPLSDDERAAYIRKSAIAFEYGISEDTTVTDTVIWHKTVTKEQIVKYLSLRTHPNPFNSEISIEVSLRQASNLDVKIYSFTGNLIKKLWSGTAPAGDNVFKWDGSDSNNRPVPSGIYFVEVSTPSKKLRKEIALLK